MKRYTKICTSICAMFVVLFCSFFITPLESKAVSNIVIQMPIGEPLISNNSGYVELLLRNKENLNYSVKTIWWNFNKNGETIKDASVSLKFDKESDYIDFYLDAGANTQAPGTNIDMYYMWNNGRLGIEYNDIFTTSDYTLTHRYNIPSTLELKGIHFYGDTEGFTTNADDHNWYTEFDVIYSGDSAIYSELQKANSNLSNIYEILSDYIAQSSSDKKEADAYKDKSQNQSDTINNATQESATNKVDKDSASSSVDGNINMDAVSSYSGVLASITNNDTVITMILIVLAVALISYVLFGKR